MKSFVELFKKNNQRLDQFPYMKRFIYNYYYYSFYYTRVMYKKNLGDVQNGDESYNRGIQEEYVPQVDVGKKTKQLRQSHHSRFQQNDGSSIDCINKIWEHINQMKNHIRQAMDDMKQQFKSELLQRQRKTMQMLMIGLKQKQQQPQFDPQPLYNCTQALKDGINVFIQSGNEGLERALINMTTEIKQNKKLQPQISIDMSNPKIEVRDQSITINPLINIPQIIIPEIKLPEINPALNIPITIPQIKIPDIHTTINPNFALPEIILNPSITPNITLPNINLEPTFSPIINSPIQNNFDPKIEIHPSVHPTIKIQPIINTTIQISKNHIGQIVENAVKQINNYKQTSCRFDRQNYNLMFTANTTKKPSKENKVECKKKIIIVHKVENKTKLKRRQISKKVNNVPKQKMYKQQGKKTTRYQEKRQIKYVEKINEKEQRQNIGIQTITENQLNSSEEIQIQLIEEDYGVRHNIPILWLLEGLYQLQAISDYLLGQIQEKLVLHLEQHIKKQRSKKIRKSQIINIMEKIINQ